MRRRMNVSKMLRKRPRNLPPVEPPEKFRLREMYGGVRVANIHPDDLRQICAENMLSFDRLPAWARAALSESPYSIRAEDVQNLIVRGLTKERIVEMIRTNTIPKVNGIRGR